MVRDQMEWILTYLEGFKYIAQIDHTRFVELDKKYHLVDFLIEYYEVGHTLDGRRTIQGLYNRIPSVETDVQPFNEDRYYDSCLF